MQPILNQPLSVKAVRTLSARRRLSQGGGHLNAERRLTLRPDAVRGCGVSRNKVRFIHTLCQAVRTGELNLRSLCRADDDTVRQVLTRYPGIGH